MAQEIRTEGDARELREFMPRLDHARVAQFAFRNPESLAAYVANKPAGAWQTSGWDDGRARFYGTETFAAAVALCRDGWKEGAARAEKIRDRISVLNPVGPRLSRFDVAGAFPWAPREAAGHPLCMKRIDSARLRKKPVITLVSDMAVNCDKGGAFLTRRAAVVAAIVDAVSLAGFACQVIGAATAHDFAHTNIAATFAVELKASNEPADIARLAFGLGHAAMYRRFIFALYGRDPFTSELGSNLGTSRPLNATPDMARRQIYVLPSGFDGNLFASDESAVAGGLAYLVDALKSQGCPAFAND